MPAIKHPINNRLKALESQIKAVPVQNATHWFLQLRERTDVNEWAKVAAYILAFDGSIDRPNDTVQSEIETYLNECPEQGTDERLIMTVAYQNIEDEYFDDDEAKEGLCVIAAIYNEVFAEAPRSLQGYARVQQREQFHFRFIKPLMERACPELANCYLGIWTHLYWLEKVLTDDTEKPLESLRAYANDLPHNAIHEFACVACKVH